MMEKNRMQFFREIMNFLDEHDPQSSELTFDAANLSVALAVGS